MHVARGGWLGQTFALAKFDDSFEGKKSGIRRSKEERKGMVETFIKRYQKLNNGDFPSLRLTRKEVGGSFYTVREIVREIIQENRVLGPPKLPPGGDQNMENLDSFLEHYPLGSMSVDLHVHVVPPKDTQTPVKEYEFRSAKVLNTKSSTEQQGKLGSDNIVDGSMNTIERSEEVKDTGYTELLVERDGEEHKGGKEIIYVERSQISGGDEVEATHAAVTNDSDEEDSYTESLERSGNKEQKNEGTELEPRLAWRSEVVLETTHVTLNNGVFEKVKNTELRMEGGMGGQKDGVNELVANQTQKHQIGEDVEVGTSPLGPVSNPVYNMDEKSSERKVPDGDLEEKDTENRGLATGNNKGFVCNEMHLYDNSTDVIDIKGEEEITGLLLESKPTLASQKTQIHSSSEGNILLDVNDNRDVKLDDTLPAEEKSTHDGIANLNISSDQPGGNSQKRRTSATLNRINLESWEAASKKSSGREANRLVTFVKAFITAFVKFWSE